MTAKIIALPINLKIAALSTRAPKYHGFPVIASSAGRTRSYSAFSREISIKPVAAPRSRSTSTRYGTLLGRTVV